MHDFVRSHAPTSSPMVNDRRLDSDDDKAHRSDLGQVAGGAHGMGIRWIRKVGAAILKDDRLLVVRKRGMEAFILPGGKPEGEETELQTLAREVEEELGCAVDCVLLAGTFKDAAAGAADAVVVVKLYTAALVGIPTPRSEIEELAWVPLRGRVGVALAPSIVNGIIPHLRRRGRGILAEGGEHHLQGVFELV